MNISRHTIENVRPSSPAPGRTIVNSIKPWAERILQTSIEMNRRAKSFNILEDLSNIYNDLLNINVPLFEKNNTDYENDVKLLSSAILSIWLTGVSTKQINKNTDLIECVKWFYSGYDKVDIQILEKWLRNINIQSLRELSYNKIFLDLYPYILEVFETDYELFLKKGTDRIKKRELGIYYTPSDVAYFMVKNVVEKKEFDLDLHEEWIDPACGTGIFLRSILEYYINNKLILNKKTDDIIRFIRERVYGIDTSKQAIQSSVFNILTFCLSQTDNNIDRPWYYYQMIRKNHAVMDSTRLNRKLIKKNFPSINHGFTFLVTNPPYSKKGFCNNYKQKTLNGEVNKTSIKKIGNYLYLDFIRMLWLFCGPNSSSSIVVPLSITYNSNREFKELRSEIPKISGTWYFANFDRTPDSLFGDDVKTRNTIIFHTSDKKTNEVKFFSTALLRWNSRQRKGFFNEIKYTRLNETKIPALIPKIGNNVELEVYNKIKKLRRGKTASLQYNSNLKEGHSRLYFAQTSYNWISVFLSNPYENLDIGTKTSFPNTVEYGTREEAILTYGILSSIPIYWLWRVEGDGFHLTRSFIKNIPFTIDSFRGSEKDIIIKNSLEMWEKISTKPIISYNAGVTTINYCPYYATENLNTINETILKNMGFSKKECEYFIKYVEETIVAKREEEIESNKNIPLYMEGIQ